MERLKIAAVAVGAAVFAVALLHVVASSVRLQSCAELKRMYEPLIGIDCRPD
jgi:hypothetical protein